MIHDFFRKAFFLPKDAVMESFLFFVAVHCFMLSREIHH